MPGLAIEDVCGGACHVAVAKIDFDTRNGAASRMGSSEAMVSTQRTGGLLIRSGWQLEVSLVIRQIAQARTVALQTALYPFRRAP
jgi:hypothetical protein